MQEHLRTGPATGEVRPTLAEDILRGADAIALFVFGDVKQRRKVYYYASEAKLKLPIFRMGNVICARKSKLLTKPVVCRKVIPNNTFIVRQVWMEASLQLCWEATPA